MGFGKDRIRSLPDAVAKVLTMHFEYLSKASVPAHVTNGNGHAQLMSQTEQPSLMPVAPAQAEVAAPAPRIAHFDLCPECGEASLASEEGCAKCYGCGYARC
jgi:ribonucleoside-diphosphate reductase alpha chain